MTIIDRPMIIHHQARDFRGALEQAEVTGRPVRFLRWGHELPVLSLAELSKRNVCRFASTGRYIDFYCLLCVYMYYVCVYYVCVVPVAACSANPNDAS